LFGLYHGNVVQGMYAFVMAVMLAWVYEYSGQLLAPVLVHGISNLTSVVAERYHLDDVKWSEISLFLMTAVCGSVMILLIIWMRKAKLKEDV